MKTGSKLGRFSFLCGELQIIAYFSCMKSSGRYLILSSYFLVWMTVFWFINELLECSGFLCALLPLLGIWVLFITSTILVFLVKPLSFKRTMIRFFTAASVTLLGYVAYYNTIDYHNFDYDFNDEVLPGIMLTIGFSLSWLVPDYLNFSNRKQTRKQD